MVLAAADCCRSVVDHVPPVETAAADGAQQVTVTVPWRPAADGAQQVGGP